MKVYILMFTCLLSFSLSAQVKQEALYEYELTNLDAKHFIVPNDDGVFMFLPRFSNSTLQYPLNIQYLNKDLELVWQSNVVIPRTMILMDFTYYEGHNYLVYQDRNDASQLKVLKVNSKERTYKWNHLEVLPDFELFDIQLIQESLILSGQVNKHAVVLLYEVQADHLRLLRSLFSYDSEMVEVRPNNDGFTFNHLVAKRNPNGRTMELSTYDYLGTELRGHELDIPENAFLLTGVSSSIIANRQFVVGLFSINRQTYPAGIFINAADYKGRQITRFYRFVEFKSFFDHLGRKTEKMINESEEAMSQGAYRRYAIDVLLDRLIETKDGIYLAAEFYRPWTTENFSDEYNLYRTRYEKVAKSKRVGIFASVYLDFTHSMLAKFSFDGTLESDNTYVFPDNYIGYHYDFQGDFTVKNNEVRYAFLNETEITIEDMEKDSTLVSSEIPLTPLSENEFVDKINEFTNKIIHWYGDKYLVTGVHLLKGKKRRRVRFVKSISIDHVN